MYIYIKLILSDTKYLHKMMRYKSRCLICIRDKNESTVLQTRDIGSLSFVPFY